MSSLSISTTASSDNNDDDNDFGQANNGDEESDDNDSQMGDLQKFYNDNTNFDPVSLKIPFIIGIAKSLSDPPDLEKEPYAHKLNNKRKMIYTPTKATLVLELKQQTGKTTVSKYTKDKIYEDFKSSPLNKKDTNFVKQTVLQHKLLLEKAITKYNKENLSVPRIVLNSDGKLLFIAAFSSDEVKEGYRTTQDTLNQTQLDARKSATYPTFDFFQLVANKMNDVGFVAEIPAMPLLHDNFLVAKRIRKGDYTMTRERVNDVYMDMRYVRLDK